MLLSTKLISVNGTEYILAYVCQDNGDERFFVKSGNGEDLITVIPHKEEQKARLVLWESITLEKTAVLQCRFKQEKWVDELHMLALRFII